MKKLFIASLVVGLLAAFSLPVLAQDNVQDPNVCDVSFDVNVQKGKKIGIRKSVDKTFIYTLGSGEISVFPLQLAEVEAFKCDVLTDNKVSVAGFIPSNNIASSFNSFTGLAQVNQAAGLLNNQGNVMAFGQNDKFGDLTPYSVSMVEAAVEKTIAGNKLTLADSVFADGIISSFNDFTGLAQVNHAAGLLNNQNNVLTVGTNLDSFGLMAENDTFLSMQNISNKADVIPLAGDASAVTTTKVVTAAAMQNSFNNFSGIAQINQAPGSLNNQANILSVAFAGR